MLLLHKRFVLSLVVPGSMLVLGTGIALTYLTQTRWTSGWLVGTTVLRIVSFAVGVLILLPAEEKAITEARALIAAEQGTVSAALRHHVAKPAVVVGEWGAQVMVAAMFYLMLAKPF